MKPGQYTGTVTEAGVFRTRNGKLQVELRLRDNDSRECISAFLSLEGGAREITRKTLARCGWTEADGGDFDAVQWTPVSYTVEEESWNGRTQLKVTRIGGGSGLVSQSARLSAGEALRALGIAGKAKTPAEYDAQIDRAVGAARSDDDELPF